MDDIFICCDALNRYLKKKFQHRRMKYINDLVDVQIDDLNYLICVVVDNDNLIMGFHEDSNYKIKEPPKFNKTNLDNIEIKDLISEDKESGVTFISLDFTANYFLFADALINGIAYYKTNASRNSENYITKRRFIFKEEFITSE